jgi:hypothetical protein
MQDPCWTGCTKSQRRRQRRIFVEKPLSLFFYGRQEDTAFILDVAMIPLDC